MVAPGSIRWRLAVTSATLTFLILCAVSVGIGQALVSRVRSDFDNELAAAVDELRDRLAVRYDSERQQVHCITGLSTYAAPNDAVVRVIDQRTGGLLCETKNAPDFRIPPHGVAPARTQDIAGYRVESRQTLLRPVGVAAEFDVPVYVQYGRRRSQVQDTIAGIQYLLLIGVVGGSGLALGAGALIARRAMRPIATLTAIVRDIGETSDPSHSIPIPDSNDEIAELAQTLDGMLQALETSRAQAEAMLQREQALLQRQRQFVADASHELRTPLTSVLANLELLVEELDAEPGDAAQSALRSSRRMRRLVADLATLARADADRAQPHEPTDMAQVVVEAVAELGPVSAGHNLRVDTRPAIVAGSRDELHRLAVNLLANAINHTPEGTNVRASVMSLNNEVVLTVEDDGPGVPSELRDRIFDRFVRGGGDSGKPSFGLGLSIVRAVAQSHGGRVELAETRHDGTRFVVTLPTHASTRTRSSGATAISP
jgi:two-component system, OmpR family, sensor kinase